MRIKISVWVMVGMMLLGFGVGAASAGEVPADINADVSILSDYVWRGQNYGDGGVVQPNLSIAFANGLSLGFWANYDIDEDRYASSHLVNEIDYTLDYSFSAGPFGLSVGYIFYDFPRGGGNTEEVYAGVSLDTLLAPTLTVYRDVDSIDGTYVSFGIGHDIELNDQMTLSLSGSIGWGSESYHDGYFGVKDSSLSDYNLGAALSYALTDKITVTPTLSYSGFADNDIADAAEAGFYQDDNNLYGGINVSYSF